MTAHGKLAYEVTMRARRFRGGYHGAEVTAQGQFSIIMDQKSKRSQQRQETNVCSKEPEANEETD